MNAEIVAIGSELLLGQIVDTNSTWMAQRLADQGINLFYKTVVGDNPARMLETITRAMERSDLVITSGGIGPTQDDLTREIVAQATARDLVLDHHSRQARRDEPSHAAWIANLHLHGKGNLVHRIGFKQLAQVRGVGINPAPLADREHLIRIVVVLRLEVRAPEDAPDRSAGEEGDSVQIHSDHQDVRCVDR